LPLVWWSRRCLLVTDHSDAEYDHDAGLEALDRRPGKGKEVQVAREKQRQIKEYKRYNSAVVSWLMAGWVEHEE
jgi:hypothetical protein